MWDRMAWVMACASALAVAGCYDSEGGPSDAGGIMLMDSGGGGGGTDAGGMMTDVDAGGGGGVDAGGPPPMLDGGGPPPPYDAGDSMGTVDCMGTPCDAATEQCCISGSVGGASASCIPIGDECMGGSTTCDGPEDCSGAGEVCCLQIMGFGGMASCTTEMCGGGSSGPGGFPSSFELCHDPSDCTDSAHMCCPVMLFGFSGAYCSEMCFGGGPTPMP